MIRQFYITIKAIEPLTFMDSGELIEVIFPLSDVKDHLIVKLKGISYDTDNEIIALFNFYERLDTGHQQWFDTYLNAKIKEVNSRTIQY